MRSRNVKRLLVPLVLEVVLLATGCGDDGAPPTDAAVADAADGTVDVAVVDTPGDTPIDTPPVVE